MIFKKCSVFPRWDRGGRGVDLESGDALVPGMFWEHLLSLFFSGSVRALRVLRTLLVFLLFGSGGEGVIWRTLG